MAAGRYSYTFSSGSAASGASASTSRPVDGLPLENGMKGDQDRRNERAVEVIRLLYRPLCCMQGATGWMSQWAMDWAMQWVMEWSVCFRGLRGGHWAPLLGMAPEHSSRWALS